MKFHENLRSRRHRQLYFGGQKSLFRHPAGTGKCPREAISIDSTAISITVAVSYDEEGVVLPRGRGLYR